MFAHLTLQVLAGVGRIKVSDLFIGESNKSDTYFGLQKVCVLVID
jgi:hypothetical protein